MVLHKQIIFVFTSFAVALISSQDTLDCYRVRYTVEIEYSANYNYTFSLLVNYNNY